jgi:hypothetical protein
MEAKFCKIFASFFVREIPAEFLPQRCLGDSTSPKTAGSLFHPSTADQQRQDGLLRQRVTPATLSTSRELIIIGNAIDFHEWRAPDDAT